MNRHADRPRWWRDLPTADLIMIAFAGLIVFEVIVTTIAVFVAEIFHPTIDTSDLVRRLNQITVNILGIVAGYLGGRSVGVAQERRRTTKDEGEG